MDSLKLYEKCLRTDYDGNRFITNKKNDYLNVLGCMVEEIKKYCKSELLEHFKKNLSGSNRSLSVLDAYVLIRNLYLCLKENNIIIDESLWDKNEDYLFKGRRYKDNEKMIAETLRLVNAIEEEIKISALKRELSQTVEKLKRCEKKYSELENSFQEQKEKISNCLNVIAQRDSVIKSLRDSLGEKEGHIRKLNAENLNLQGEIEDLQDDKRSLEDEIKSINNEPILEAQRQVTLRARERRIQLGRGILNWQEQQKNTRECLLPLQKDIQESLKILRDYENKITNDYILRFVDAMLVLYNDIHSCYESQCRIKESWENPNYHNAVNNYQVFLDEIVDELYSFGIEDIFSATNEPFDGKIHEVVDAGKTNLRNAVVCESIRAGFRYNDVVVQKEKVRVKELLIKEPVLEPNIDSIVEPIVLMEAVEPEINIPSAEEKLVSDDEAREQNGDDRAPVETEKILEEDNVESGENNEAVDDNSVESANEAVDENNIESIENENNEATEENRGGTW